MNRTAAFCLWRMGAKPKMIDDSVAFAQFCLAQAEEQNIRCLDAGRWGVTMAYDGVHFTEQGHRAFAEGLYKEICL